MEDINGDSRSATSPWSCSANEVTNPSAKTDPSSPIYGMSVLDVAAARTVMVVKRGIATGFAGVDNDLYYLDKTLMLLGDAKGVADGLLRELETVPAKSPGRGRSAAGQVPQGVRPPPTVMVSPCTYGTSSLRIHAAVAAISSALA